MTFAVVTGAKGGLGSLIVTSLESEGITVLGIDKEDIDHRYRLHAIQEWKRSINLQKIDILVNCAGITSIDYLENLDPTDYYNLFDINCSSITWMVQELLPLLRGSTVCNILSTASNTPMTASIAYNASKAAAQMVTRQMARELKPRHDITVFGIAPNKLKGTPMSESVEKRICEVRGWSKSMLANTNSEAFLLVRKPILRHLLSLLDFFFQISSDIVILTAASFHTEFKRERYSRSYTETTRSYRHSSSSW